MKELNFLKRNLLKLECTIDEVKLDRDQCTKRYEMKAPGSHILDIFKRSGIVRKDVDRIAAIIEKITSYLNIVTCSCYATEGASVLHQFAASLREIFWADAEKLDKTYQTLVYEWLPGEAKDAAEEEARRGLRVFMESQGGYQGVGASTLSGRTSWSSRVPR